MTHPKSLRWTQTSSLSPPNNIAPLSLRHWAARNNEFNKSMTSLYNLNEVYIWRENILLTFSTVTWHAHKQQRGPYVPSCSRFYRLRKPADLIKILFLWIGWKGHLMNWAPAFFFPSACVSSFISPPMQRLMIGEESRRAEPVFSTGNPESVSAALSNLYWHLESVLTSLSSVSGTKTHTINTSFP